MQSVKTSQGIAIYRAECSHVFHFPCIAAHVRKQGSLVCPVCKNPWRDDEPLLAIHKLQHPHHQNKEQQQEESINKKQELNKQPQEKKITSNHDGISYSDDEPLLSPTAGGPFIPIPETEENEEVVVEEFQGFFTNPITSSMTSSTDLRDVEARLMQDVAVVSVSRTHETYAVVLKVRAPPTPPPAHSSRMAHILGPSRRAPIDLVTVLDVGGSMGGTKLQMLKRAMRLVISSLGSADRLSIIAFSAYPQRLLPLRRMTTQGQRSAQRIIDQLACSHGSSAGDALRQAAKILEDRRERNPVASIILLSDGQDDGVNASNSNQRQAYSHVSSTRFAHIEIPTQSFGLEPAEDAFTKCVGGLLSVVVQDLRIQLGVASGSDPAEICAVYSSNGRPTALGSGTISLGDLYAEEERELLVELRVPRCNYGSHNVFSVVCSYKDPATQQVIYGREQALLVPLPQAVDSSVPMIERLRYLFLTTRAIAESRRLVEHNELSSAQRLLLSTRALLMQSSSKLADDYIRGLQAELAGINWRRQNQQQKEMMELQQHKTIEREVGLMVDENGEPLTPTSAWRAAEQLAKVAVMKKSLNRVSDLHGFENARF